MSRKRPRANKGRPPKVSPLKAPQEVIAAVPLSDEEVEQRVDAAVWASIRADYESGIVSTDQMADNYGIPASEIERRIAQEGWVRIVTTAPIVDELVEGAAQQGAQLRAEVIARHRRQCGGILEAAYRTLAEVSAWSPDDLTKKTRALSDLSGVFASMQRQERLAYSIDEAESDATNVANEIRSVVQSIRDRLS